MIALTALEGSELTNYVIKILRKYGLNTVRDLLISDVDNLCKITNLSKPSLLSTKHDVLERYCPQPVEMSRLYLNVVEKSLVYYQSGIHSLDAILGGDGFCGGSLLEVCGFTGIGKTQLCLTIAVNFAGSYKRNVLYIDAKSDCLGSRIYKILKSRKVTKFEMGQIMLRIKYQRALSVQDILNIFESFLQKLEENCPDTMKIKLIVIDSVSALWLHVFATEQLLNGMYELSRLANVMQKLSNKFCIVFIFVNVLVPVKKQSLKIEVNEHEEDTDDDSEYMEANPFSLVKPALGNFWLGVPTVRLIVESSTLSASGNNCVFRDVRVLKNSFGKTGEICHISITDSGIV